MSQQKTENDFEWLKQKIALSEERGDIIPGGAVGGAVARARRKAEGQSRPSAAERARRHVRFVAFAISAEEEQAA